MGNGYDERLEDILTQYQMKRDGVVDGSHIHNTVVDLFLTRCSGKRVALWGAGASNTTNSHASVIINKYATYVQGLVCIIDSEKKLQGTDFMGFPIIAPEEVDNHNIDVIIISSKASANSIKNSIATHAPNCEYLDIYGELAQRGIPIITTFFDSTSIYGELYDVRVRYEQMSAGEEKGRTLLELIAAYLGIRDFFYAFRYIKEYVAAQYERWQELARMQSAITDLLEEVRQKSVGKKNDVLVFLVDSMRAIDLLGNQDGKTTFHILKDYCENAYVFTNAYSTGPTTYESMIAIVNENHSFIGDCQVNGYGY